MKNFLNRLFVKKEKVYGLHVITCTDNPKKNFYTSHIIQQTLDDARIDYLVQEGDSSLEWEFYVSTQEELDYAHKALDDLGLWDHGRGFRFTFS
jgi:hypothetical protein